MEYVYRLTVAQTKLKQFTHNLLSVVHELYMSGYMSANRINQNCIVKNIS